MRLSLPIAKARGIPALSLMAIMVGTTVDSNQEAQNIAAACVKSGIAACAHIDEIKSLFFWDGEVKDGVEYRVFLKTVDASYEAIADVINSHHSYDEPAIFCIPISRGSDTYLKWIEDNSTAKSSSKAPQDTPSL